MFGIRFLVWTVLCTYFGILLATYNLGGRTPLEHMQRLWRASPGPAKVDDFRKKIKGALSDTGDDSAQLQLPTEHHSAADREEVNRLITQRAARSPTASAGHPK